MNLRAKNCYFEHITASQQQDMLCLIELFKGKKREVGEGITILVVSENRKLFHGHCITWNN